MKVPPTAIVLALVLVGAVAILAAWWQAQSAGLVLEASRTVAWADLPREGE